MHHRDQLWQLRVCHYIPVRWMQAGHLSLAAPLVLCMCCLRGVGGWPWTNLSTKILALFSRVSRAFPETCQLMDVKVYICWDHVFLS